MVDYGLSLYDAEVLVDEPGAAEYFDTVLIHLLKGNSASVRGKNKCSSKKLAKQALNWVTNELLGRMRGVGLTFAELSEGTHTAFGDALSPAEMAALVEAVQDRKISGKIGKAALDAVFGNECGDEEGKEVAPRCGGRGGAREGKPGGPR